MKPRNIEHKVKDKRLKQHLRKIGLLADKKGVNAYLVGGPVRDLLLGFKVLDIDIVVEGDSLALAQAYARKMKMDLKTYPAFNTATLSDADLHIDVAMARSETYARSGALPKVSASDLKHDLFRRDFTINALAMSINQANFGDLHDDHKGLKDLKEKKVRIIHDKSFTDDPTRMVRLIRFEQRLGFKMDSKTLALLKTAVKENRIENVSHQRWFVELKKLLSESNPQKHIKRARQLKLYSFLSDSLNFKVFALLEKKLNTKAKEIKIFAGVHRWVLFLGELLRSVKPEKRSQFFKQYKLPASHQKSLLQIVESEDIIKALLKPGIKDSEIFSLLRPFSQDVLCYLWASAPSVRASRRVYKYVSCLKGTKLLINGEDVKRMTSLRGARIGEVLDETLLQKIDRCLKTRNQELAVLKQLVSDK